MQERTFGKRESKTSPRAARKKNKKSFPLPSTRFSIPIINNVFDVNNVVEEKNEFEFRKNVFLNVLFSTLRSD